MVKLQAVLFDLDGTLLDSAHDITQGLNKMLADEGRESLTVPEVKAMIGDGAMELCRRALVKTGGCEADDLFPYVQKFIAHYRKIDPDPAQVYEGAREFLDNCQAKGIKLGVCTNKPDEATHAVLETLGLAKYFGFIAGGDTFMVHKPNPGHVTGVLEKLGAPVEATLFLGDGPADVAACKAARVKCILMTHGYAADFEELDADGLADNFVDVPAKLSEVGFEW
ncbi:MAG: HAD family hydrolase [Bdellovibrionales bacterium]